MRSWLVTVTLCALLLTGTVSARSDGAAINMVGGTVGLDHEVLQSAVNRFMIANPDVTVRILYVPEKSSNRLVLLRNFLEAQSPELDVIQLDVVWAHELAGHLLDLAVLTESVLATDPSLLAATTVGGRLVSLPWYVTTGVLFYRSDLLSKYGFDGPPRTLTELEQMASVIQAGERAAGNDDFWGYVWQGDAYEGLTVNALEWWHAAGAGSLLERSGHISVNNPAAVSALERARAWIGTISPPAVLGFAENQAVEQFTHGQAAFLRSWQTDHAIFRDSPRLAGRYGVARLPTEQPVGMHGGSGLAISAYSEAPEAALRLVEFLVSDQEQRTAALDAARIPTRPALYGHPVLNLALPFLSELQPVLTGGTRRPVTPVGSLWAAVSALTFATVHEVLRGDIGAGDALVRLEEQLVGITGLPAGPVPPQ